MVEEQSHLSTIHDSEDQETGLQPREEEEKGLKEGAVGTKEEVMSLKESETTDSLHEDTGEADKGNEAVDTEVEIPPEDKETMSSKEEMMQIPETITETVEDAKTEDEISSNNVDPEADTESIQTTEETENDGETGRGKDEESERKEETSQATAKETSEDSQEPGSPETASAVKDKAPAVKSSDKKPSQEKERPERKNDLPRSRTMPKSYGRATRKDIAEKFGGVATSGVRVQRSTSCGASAVKNMLLEWCRAKTRGREGVDIQNFSSSWSSGLAFCALIHAFFPDAFDYDALDPKNRRENFQLAFSTAETHADCPPLLDVEDMVHMKVPDSKCVYTYVQELYRSLVTKGLVKTKKV
ncbi:smoothelin-like protein 1 [Pelodytes ibericus]